MLPRTYLSWYAQFLSILMHLAPRRFNTFKAQTLQFSASFAIDIVCLVLEKDGVLLCSRLRCTSHISPETLSSAVLGASEIFRIPAQRCNAGLDLSPSSSFS